MKIRTDDEYFMLRDFVENYYLITGHSSMDKSKGKTFTDTFNDLEKISTKKAKEPLQNLDTLPAM